MVLKEKFIEYIKNQNIIFIGTIDVKDIVINRSVRKYCMENKCGQYGNNFMCPPCVGSVEDFKEKLKNYDSCIVVLKNKKITNKINREEYYEASEELHQILLNIEYKAKSLGYEKALALIAGNCRLCKPCKKVLGEKFCPYPERARPSSESLGIDVIETLNKLGVKLEFRDDEVTWVGMMLK
ncbi:DUF2284 domain-containing protein [Sporanaerobacter acetigenes]|uniref:Predicted metal-binding protein n=1 Tax=Sporanaerobacter acetigenes DSM 13106 TaxID=1123281 RepID=A0A1M5Z2E9_9FIRM|nr:DUF2284 domain-containing protein [Sporanaerobacter acetigenes]SHI18427.1 Predicted metal-binding protein [Sporanaerobacter acetigenes DSM 13106]